MAYLYNLKTQKYNVHITIPSLGIKEPQTRQVGSFDTEIEAIAGAKVAKNMLRTPFSSFAPRTLSGGEAPLLFNKIFPKKFR